MSARQPATRDQSIRQDRRDAASQRPGRSRWPIPHDKPVDRARTLAGALLAALQKADPDAAADIMERAHRYGETWLGAAATTAQGPWLTRAQVAELAGVEPDTVSQWTTRGKLTRHPNGYAEREVMDLLAAMRTHTTTARR